MSVSVRLQADPFDPGEETNAFLADRNGDGATVTFTGLVRSTPEKPVDLLVLEHYGPLAEKQIHDIAEQALKRCGLSAITVIHRYGEMIPNEPIVQVMAASPHREAAFQGAGFVMDWLKTDAPFWKREDGPDGRTWVESRKGDEQARKFWEDE
jgi:molybdopterin synthase catalytic subunit